MGVARQYCGQLGKQDNCQVAVSLSVATGQASLPVAYQLYLPEGWANDPDRRAKAGVPEDVTFHTKPEIALAQIRAALEAGVSRSVVLAEAGYGNDTAFRTGLTEIGLTYVVGVQILDLPVAAGHATAAAEALERTRSPALARPAPARTRAGFRQGTGASPARGRLAPHHLARGRQGAARLALCRRPRPSSPSRLLAHRIAT